MTAIENLASLDEAQSSDDNNSIEQLLAIQAEQEKWDQLRQQLSDALSDVNNIDAALIDSAAAEELGISDSDPQIERFMGMISSGAEPEGIMAEMVDYISGVQGEIMRDKKKAKEFAKKLEKLMSIVEEMARQIEQQKSRLADKLAERNGQTTPQIQSAIRERLAAQLRELGKLSEKIRTSQRDVQNLRGDNMANKDSALRTLRQDAARKAIEALQTREAGKIKPGKQAALSAKDALLAAARQNRLTSERSSKDSQRASRDSQRVSQLRQVNQVRESATRLKSAQQPADLTQKLNAANDAVRNKTQPPEQIRQQTQQQRLQQTQKDSANLQAPRPELTARNAAERQAALRSQTSPAQNPVQQSQQSAQRQTAAEQQRNTQLQSAKSIDQARQANAASRLNPAAVNPAAINPVVQSPQPINNPATKPITPQPLPPQTPPVDLKPTTPAPTNPAPINPPRDLPTSPVNEIPKDTIRPNPSTPKDPGEIGSDINKPPATEVPPPKDHADDTQPPKPHEVEPDQPPKESEPDTKIIGCAKKCPCGGCPTPVVNREDALETMGATESLIDFDAEFADTTPNTPTPNEVDIIEINRIAQQSQGRAA